MNSARSRRLPRAQMASRPPSREASATLRDQLLAELEALELKDGLDAWTLLAWPKANSLTPADGDEVKLAFQTRLARTTPDEDLSPAERDRPAATQRSAPASTRACWQSRWRVACATRPTCGLWPNSRALFADASPAMPTICGLRNPAVSVSRSAMNLRSHCAGGIIGSCTGAARKSIGGRELASSRSTPRAGSGSKHIRWQSRQIAQMATVPKQNPRPLEMRRQPFRRDGEWKVQNKSSCRARQDDLASTVSNRNSARRAPARGPRLILPLITERRNDPPRRADR